jgi:uncharacterized protein (TIGR01777 family)
VKVLVSGSSGLIGAAVTERLRAAGHTPRPLLRSEVHSRVGAVLWNPAADRLDPAAWEGVDAIVHLAGESIAGRWTEEKKRRIRDSRVNGTRLLGEAVAQMAKPPQVFVCASAIGYYGSRGDEVLREDSAPGSDFLAGVCREWEAATQPAADKGVRVVNLRFGVVLSGNGGALAKMLLPFRLGAGGVIGNGRQYWSWVALEDAVAAIEFALTIEKLAGPANVVSPNPATNRQFTKTLARALGKPAIFPMPSFAAKLVFGEMAGALLLASQRVEPVKLREAGFEFRFPELEAALRQELTR